jgi:hypothetical protein
MCSYCYRVASDDCSSWSEARGCSGITGPDDPKRLARIIVHKQEEAYQLRREADELERKAAEAAAHKRRYADSLDKDRARITAQLDAAA